MVYQAVVREGSAAQQEDLLNQGLRRQVWSELTLPVRCWNAWETAFPELSSRSVRRSAWRDPMPDGLHHQRRVTRLLLAQLADAGFAVAGSGAIRDHVLTARPTEDVDLFAPTPDGYTAELRRAELFARLEVTAGEGPSWRPTSAWTGAPRNRSVST